MPQAIYYFSGSLMAFAIFCYRSIKSKFLIYWFSTSLNMTSIRVNASIVFHGALTDCVCSFMSGQGSRDWNTYSFFTQEISSQFLFKLIKPFIFTKHCKNKAKKLIFAGTQILSTSRYVIFMIYSHDHEIRTVIISWWVTWVEDKRFHYSNQWSLVIREAFNLPVYYTFNHT